MNTQPQSQTPKTDAKEYCPIPYNYVVPSDFTRTLELEVQELEKQIEFAKDLYDNQTNDDIKLREQFNQLKLENQELREQLEHEKQVKHDVVRMKLKAQDQLTTLKSAGEELAKQLSITDSALQNHESPYSKVFERNTEAVTKFNKLTEEMK